MMHMNLIPKNQPGASLSKLAKYQSQEMTILSPKLMEINSLFSEDLLQVQESMNAIFVRKMELPQIGNKLERQVHLNQKSVRLIAPHISMENYTFSEVWMKITQSFVTCGSLMLPLVFTKRFNCQQIHLNQVQEVVIAHVFSRVKCTFSVEFLN